MSEIHESTTDEGLHEASWPGKGRVDVPTPEEVAHRALLLRNNAMPETATMLEALAAERERLARRLRGQEEANAYQREQLSSQQVLIMEMQDRQATEAGERAGLAARVQELEAADYRAQSAVLDAVHNCAMECRAETWEEAAKEFRARYPHGFHGGIGEGYRSAAEFCDLKATEARAASVPKGQ